MERFFLNRFLVNIYLAWLSIVYGVLLDLAIVFGLGRFWINGDGPEGTTVATGLSHYILGPILILLLFIVFHWLEKKRLFIVVFGLIAFAISLYFGLNRLFDPYSF